MQEVVGDLEALYQFFVTTPFRRRGRYRAGSGTTTIAVHAYTIIPGGRDDLLAIGSAGETFIVEWKARQQKHFVALW